MVTVSRLPKRTRHLAATPPDSSLSWRECEWLGREVWEDLARGVDSKWGEKQFMGCRRIVAFKAFLRLGLDEDECEHLARWIGFVCAVESGRNCTIAWGYDGFQVDLRVGFYA